MTVVEDRRRGQAELDAWHMARAIELAAHGLGHVEPNPPVGCVIARGAEIIGEGWHRRFGGPHAEVEALAVARERARGATLYVTLEPCRHHGKTGPCTQAVLAAGISRVVAAVEDPFPVVAGAGFAELRAAGLDVAVGVGAEAARRLLAPYLMLVRHARPWVIAKWAMTADGRIATHAGESRWISGPESRARVHELRGLVDAIVVGRGTVVADDPLLTARPAGPRTALRVILDRRLQTSPDAAVVRSRDQGPVLFVAGPQAEGERRRRLESVGCEVWTATTEDEPSLVVELLAELGRRRLTRLLVEGGARVLGAFRDAAAIDEVLVFLGPLLVGGAGAPAAVSGQGAARLAAGLRLERPAVTQLGSDVVLQARVERDAPPAEPSGL
jgi:diaminohydroxyphosphoribosylaminopyrimidine deaminase/5-amino-6-(5-phosphoribosylamino)uracil reductase